MIVSCSTYGYRFITIEGTLKRISKLGFKAVDIMATRPHLLPSDYEDFTKIKDLLASLKLKVSAITAFDGHPQWHLTAANKKHREDTVEHVKLCIELANVVGSRTVQVITGMPLIQDISFKKAWEYARENLKICADYAGKYGIFLALEGEENNVVRTSQDILNMLEEVNNPNCKALLEVGHANMMATDDPVCAIETLKNKIVHCHIHDNKGVYDEHAVPGDGTVYWKGVLEKLKEIKYEGYLALELLVTNADEGAMRGKHYIDSHLKEI
jgi:sugar phosphate isomerase/epimerase